MGLAMEVDMSLNPDRLFPLDAKEAELLARISRRERAFDLDSLSREELRLGQSITTDEFYRRTKCQHDKKS